MDLRLVRQINNAVISWIVFAHGPDGLPASLEGAEPKNFEQRAYPVVRIARLDFLNLPSGPCAVTRVHALNGITKPSKLNCRESIIPRPEVLKRVSFLQLQPAFVKTGGDRCELAIYFGMPFGRKRCVSSDQIILHGSTTPEIGAETVAMME